MVAELAGAVVDVLFTVVEDDVGLAVEEVAVVAGRLEVEVVVVVCLLAVLLVEGFTAEEEEDVRDVFTVEPEVVVEVREVVVDEGLACEVDVGRSKEADDCAL